ncbi:MAG: hypothetical protein KKB51_21840 [Candidatus Riflebacteria bacterium]|nr:hypothetical protein [Candidatus Riflebacteria bacterium]
MKKNLTGILALVALLCVFTLVENVVLALKNVCPECNFLIEDLELTACPKCGRVLNKCLICGAVNPAKNDNCYNCQASLAESRVLATIDVETRDSMRLGESTRAQIEVELGQIKERIATGELTPALAAREVELLTKMGWWSKANTLASEFAVKFPDSDKNVLISACRVKALRNLSFLAIEDEEFDVAIGYLKAALEIDPKDKKSQNLLKIAESK